MEDDAESSNEIKDYIEPLEDRYSQMCIVSNQCDAALVRSIYVIDEFISAEIDAKAENSDERIGVYIEVKNKMEFTQLNCHSFQHRLMNKFLEINRLMITPPSIINDELLNYITDQYHATNAIILECSDIIEETNATIAFVDNRLDTLQ